ncbi:MAG TPA: hypothetical protein VFI06_16270 [Chitinophagaceae bacterium]|nr:hypothetical protein [Chitinophagaceae bacterium]
MNVPLPTPSDPSSIIITYKTLRRWVGWLGLTLPPVLVLGSFIIDKTWHVQISVSAYYHTGMRNGLVGCLCGVALFLVSYHGYKWYDSLISKAAGVFALCVAFFPTSPSTVKDDLFSKLHYITSGFFLVLLACMSIFLFTKSEGIKTSEKKNRNRLYRICGIGMLVCVAGIPIDSLPGIHDRIIHLKPTLILEAAGLIFFGVSWLIKGEGIAPLNDKPVDIRMVSKEQEDDPDKQKEKVAVEVRQ